MEHRGIVRFFSFKSLSARHNATEFASVYGKDAPALPIAKKWRRRFLLGRPSLCEDPRSGRLVINNLTKALASMLQERPFISRKILCQHFRIAKQTCLQKFQFAPYEEKIPSSLVPHALEADRKAKRVTFPNDLPVVLESERPVNFKHLITGDKLCFFFTIRRTGRGVSHQSNCQKG
jgi:hypothetical protein